jgi:diaminopimelate decarboxylase
MISIAPQQYAHIAQTCGTPLYVYDKEMMVHQYFRLRDHIIYSPKKIYYACKANSNLSILKIFKDLGCGVDVVSAGELFLAMKAGFTPDQILFTGNNLAKWEMEYAAHHDILMTLDSLSQLKTYGKINPHADVCIRINPNLGAGHHKHVITGGLQSKFGIYHTKMGAVKDIAKKYHLHIVGVHQHIGSGILDSHLMLHGIASLLEVATNFSHIQFIDIGGGLGIPYHPTDAPLDTETYGRELSSLLSSWVETHGTPVTLIIEPGRFLVAQSGTLLTRVTAIKSNPKYTFVGTDTGFNHLMRPILYAAHHEISAVGSRDKNYAPVTVCGNICESGDIFAKNRDLPPLKEGDLLAIHDVGAYGFSMASLYNGRVLPPEVLLDGEELITIRRRGEFKDLLHNQIYEVYEND